MAEQMNLGNDFANHETLPLFQLPERTAAKTKPAGLEQLTAARERRELIGRGQSELPERECAE